MPRISLHDAEWHCRRLSFNVSQPYRLSEGNVVIGASFGIAEVPLGSGETCDEALRRAGQALYHAKATGRGKVVLSAAYALARAIGWCRLQARSMLPIWRRTISLGLSQPLCR